MPIATYDELKATIIDYAVPGGEPAFNAAVPGFIRLAEARFDRELERHNSVGVATIITDEAFPALPSDWNETISISEVDGWPLKSLTIVQGEVLERYGVGHPHSYAMVDGGFRLIPAPDAERTYRMTYRRELQRLSDANQSNWLLELSPDLYLYASLVNAEAYLKNDEAIGKWAAAAQQIIDSMNLQSLKQEYGQGRPLVREITFG